MPRIETSSSSAIGSVEIETTLQGSAVVRVAGDQDLSNVAELRAVLATAAATAPQVVVDLRDAAFVSAAFIGALAEADQRAARSGGRLVLRSPSPTAARLLRICGLDELVESPTNVRNEDDGEVPSQASTRARHRLVRV